MKTTTFNLNSFRKKAYYEDAKGLMQGQSRGWMNCYKIKVSEGVSPHDAINSCMEEYQNKEKSNWSQKYS